MQLCELGIKQIKISGDNPRIINKKSEEFRELVESIKAIGVKVPIHVREKPTGKYDKDRFFIYELLAGERRLLAAEEAGLEMIPALNHGDLMDEAAFEVTFAENFAREDLTVLEQGKAVATLLDKYKGDAAAVASKMGKSIRWVMQRRAIHENLSPLWKEAVLKNPDLKDWTASHLQLVAAMPVNIQDDLFENWECDTPTVKELEKDIADRMRLLAEASWDKEDPKLVKGVKACSKCTKRSSSRPGLFDDTTDEETIKKNDRCLDKKCWDAKAKAYITLKAAELKTKYKNIIYAVMPDEQLCYSEKSDLALSFGDVTYQWKAAKEGEKEAVPALIVYGRNAGELRWVKFPKNIHGKTPQGCESRKPKTLKERREMLKKKRWFVVIRNLIEKIQESPVEKIVCKEPVFTVMALAVAFGTSDDFTSYEEWDGFKKLKSMDIVLKRLWESVRETIWKSLSYCGPITQTPDELIESAWCAAELLGIDISAIFKEAAENEYPEPKAWAHLNENGTEKNATKAKKSKTEGK